MSVNSTNTTPHRKATTVNMHTIATFTNHTFRGTGRHIVHGSIGLGYYDNNQIALVIYEGRGAPYATATINLSDFNINPPLGHIVIPNSGAFTDLWLDLADLNIIDTDAQFVGYGQFNEQAVIAPFTRHIANQYAHLIF